MTKKKVKKKSVSKKTKKETGEMSFEDFVELFRLNLLTKINPEAELVINRFIADTAKLTTEYNSFLGLTAVIGANILRCLFLTMSCKPEMLDALLEGINGYWDENGIRVVMKKEPRFTE